MPTWRTSYMTFGLFLLLSGGLVQMQDRASIIEVSLSEGTNMAFALAPNGLDYVVDLHGTLWAGKMKDQSLAPITPKKMDARQPCWSNDGTTIFFQAYADGNWHIYGVAMASNKITQITSGKFDHREPSIHPHDNKLLFAADINGKYDIWQLDLVTGKQKLLVVEEEGESYGAAWHADGRNIAYINRLGNTHSLCIQSGKTNEKRIIYSTGEKLFACQFNRSGERLYFVSTNATESKLMNVDMTKDQIDPQQISMSGADVFPFKISQVKNDEIFYTANGQIIKHQIIENSTEFIPFLAKVQLERPVYDPKSRNFDLSGRQKIKGIYQPVISPDGEHIAFVSLGDIWIANRQGHCRRITHDAFVQLAPAWSRNGQSLAYASDRQGASIWCYQVATDRKDQIAQTPTLASGLDWSPGDSLVIGSFNFGPRSGTLIQYAVTSGKSKRIGRSLPFSISRPSMSPSGEHIAITLLQPYSTLYREGVNRIVIVPADGSSIRSVKGMAHRSFGMRGNDGPSWSSDGKWLAFVSEGFLWKAALDTAGNIKGAPEQLTSELSESISWTADAKTLLYQTPTTLKTINVENQSIQERPVRASWTAVEPSDKWIIQATNVLDHQSGSWLRNHDILISGRRIAEITPHQSDQVGPQVIDGRNKYVVPGLIDVHAHQASEVGEVLGRQWLAWGVTSTRDPATNPYDALNRKEAQQSNNLLGPRIFFTGSPLDGNRVYYNGTYALQNKAQLELELQRAEDLDYDMIKTYVRLPDHWQEMVVQRAHQLGIPVSSHELYPAVSYQMDGVEHILGTSRRGYNTKMSRIYNAYSDVTDLIAQSKMFFTPTIGIYVAYDYLLASDSSILSDDRMTTLYPPFVITSAREKIAQVNDDQMRWQVLFQRAANMIKEVHDKGGTIVAGTDSPIVPYGMGLHLELEAYARSGMPNHQVLRAATANAARAIGIDADLGSIEEGKLADLLILNNDPLQDIRHLRQLSTIVLDGKIITPLELLHERATK